MQPEKAIVASEWDKWFFPSQTKPKEKRVSHGNGYGDHIYPNEMPFTLAFQNNVNIHFKELCSEFYPVSIQFRK